MNLLKSIYLGLAVLVAPLAMAEKPNILFILIDDMGYLDLGCNGSDLYRTPNIDKLATQGTRFTHARTAAHVCSPTRASIITGKYPARIGLTDWLAGHEKPYAKLKIPAWQKGLPASEITIAEILKPQGYATGWFGKWHLGEAATDPEHGFETGHQDWKENTKEEPEDPKGVFQLNHEAFEFIKKNKDKPFFVGLSHYSVHGPIRYEENLKNEYSTVINEKRTLQTNAGYAAMVEALDTSIGEVMAFLENEKLVDNTLVIFFSDNGGASQFTNNAPLRAGKGTLYEGGVRVPMIARWPGRVPAGKSSDAKIFSTDFLPTFGALAKAQISPDVDGIDITAVLEGKDEPKREALYWHYPHYHAEKPSGAIIKGDWKLIEWFETGATELFNLKDDPNELADLSDKEPKKTKELLDALNIWRTSVNAQIMVENPAYDPARENEGPPKKPKKDKKDKNRAKENSKTKAKEPNPATP